MFHDAKSNKMYFREMSEIHSDNYRNVSLQKGLIESKVCDDKSASWVMCNSIQYGFKHAGARQQI